jgi:hypothetical protein
MKIFNNIPNLTLPTEKVFQLDAIVSLQGAEDERKTGN